MSKWIKKGDKVLVIAGNDKGKTGDVISRTEERILIQGVNIRKKHAKRKTKAPGTEILEMEVPVHISNVALCNGDGNRIKVKVRQNKTGAKELYYLDGGKEVSFRQLNKNS
jgi:large subunit ribosomal protein L24